MVGYQFAKDYKECVKAYNTSIAEQIEANKDADYIVDNGDGKWDIDDVARPSRVRISTLRQRKTLNTPFTMFIIPKTKSR